VSNDPKERKEKEEEVVDEIHVDEKNSIGGFAMNIFKGNQGLAAPARNRTAIPSQDNQV